MLRIILRKSTIFILLLPVLLLQGCFLANMPVYVPPYVPAPPEIEDPLLPVIPSEPDTGVQRPGRFILRYEPENSLNPIIALNRDNISITSLMYEPLFALNNNLVARQILCSSCETEDNITFTIHILPDIAMHDGSTLTADDVAYSLRQAKSRGPHRNKLVNLSNVTSDGELTVTATLTEANARFTRLLDIPIIKNNSVEDEIPPGTGPYTFPNPDNYILTPFVNHRDYDDMQLSTIYLRVCDDNQLTELFDQGDISLLWDDPTSTFEVRINRDNEPRYFDTSTLQFLGFNADTDVLGSPDVRRAIGCAIERETIVDTIMNVPRAGQTVPAPVAISPIFNLYDENWEPTNDLLSELGALLIQARIADYNDDGILERYDGAYGIPFSLDFIVNVENAFKVLASEHIAESLRKVGFDVDVRVLAWADFIKALNDGDFDLFYGEVQLGADFDFSPLLLPGSLNYGKTADSATYSYAIREFLAASSAEEVSIAGKVLCDEIRYNAPFVPILYKRYAIYYPVGAITGAEPSQSGTFYNFDRWSIDLDMLT